MSEPHSDLYCHLFEAAVVHAVDIHEPQEAVANVLGAAVGALLRHVDVSREDLLAIVVAAFDCATEEDEDAEEPGLDVEAES